MKRRKFILAGGTILTAASLFSLTQTTEAKHDGDNSDAKNRRPDPEKIDVPILKAIAYGLNAPNPHNTQAWKFKILNQLEALFYVAETRLITITDPPARQVHIGCGAFLAMFQIGASTFGYTSCTEYLPDGIYNFSEIGKKPVARLSLKQNPVQPDPLARYIFTRQTNRSVYTGNILTEADFERILLAAKPKYAEVTLVNEPKMLHSTLELLYKGMEVECHDWNAYDESRKWFRVKGDIGRKKDGINLRVGGTKPGFNLWMTETLLEGYSKGIWHSNYAINELLKGHHEKVMSSKGVVTFKTNTNNLTDWIQCGEDYTRFQLAANSADFCINPLSQVLQEYPAMKDLNTQFNALMKVEEPGKIQMAVRIGKSEKLEYSYRRDENDFLI